MNVPRLRFKDNDGQEFPEWEKRQLGDLCSTFKSGLGITSEKISDSAEYPVYGGNGLRGYTNTYTHDDFFVLIGRQGALCGNINRSRGKAYISEHAIAVNANETSNTEWLAYKLDCMKLNRLSESSAQPGLSVNKLLQLKLIVPAKPEQTKIANFLTAIDKKISQLTQKYDLLKQYKKGIMQQIFSQMLRFKDDDEREFPEWKERNLKDIAHINPKTDLLPDEFVYIDLESVEKGILLKETTISKDIAPSRAQRLLRKEDVLFQMVRPYQKNNLFFDKTGIYVASTGYAQIRAYEDSRFLYHCLHLDDFIAEVMNRCTGTSYPAINSSDLASITIQVPTKEEQTKIANFLTAIDDKITHTQTRLDAAKLYKKGLLQQMFV